MCQPQDRINALTTPEQKLALGNRTYTDMGYDTTFNSLPYTLHALKGSVKAFTGLTQMLATR
jgi:hypothetical protein